ncbi:MAG: hypothetical protein COB66_07885 [Coxiella sp. (in: Bacteria)]|nr:MAG: hypothetical protein COB66_07885 [Coxiella sp. (in: g-proteobacteria)]
MAIPKSELPVLIGVSLFSFMGYMDATIVPTALPAIQVSLHMGVVMIQWVLNAFYLPLSMMVLSISSLLKCVGRRVIFLAVLVYALASIGAGLSLSSDWLIGFRIIQGFSSAVILPSTAIYVTTHFTGGNKYTAMCIFSIISGLGLVIGPVLGSVIIQELSWPWVFFSNVPLIIIGVSLCFFNLRETKTTSYVTLDFSGMTLISLTVFSLVLGLVESSSFGWNSHFVVVCFCTSAIALMAFVIVERHAQTPIIELKIFRNATVIAILMLAFLGGGATAVFMFFNPLYLHGVLSFSYYKMGGLLLIIPVAELWLLLICSQWIHTKITLKMLLVICALLYVCATVLQLYFTVKPNYFIISLAYTCFGAAWGILSSTKLMMMRNREMLNDMEVSIGTLYGIYYIGATVMLAACIGIFHGVTAEAFYSVLPVAQTDTQHTLITGFISQPSYLQDALNHIDTIYQHSAFVFKNVFMHGMMVMLWPFLILSSFLFMLITLIVKGKKT